MKFTYILLMLFFIYNANAKYCTNQQDCGDSQYYECRQNTCCKKQGLGCGAFYSWGCCNGSCKIPNYHATGTCP